MPGLLCYGSNRAELLAMGHSTIPVTVIAGQQISGFDPEQLERMLDSLG